MPLPNYVTILIRNDMEMGMWLKVAGMGWESSHGDSLIEFSTFCYAT